MAEVFVSYKEEDGILAASIAAAIEATGHSVWYFQRDSIAGIEYTNQVPDEIKRCLVVVVLVSPASIMSHQVTKEIGFAHNLGRLFVPVLIGMSHAEFAAARKDWDFMFGTASTVSIGAAVKDDYARIVMGVQTLLAGVAAQTAVEKTVAGPLDKAAESSKRTRLLWLSASVLAIGAIATWLLWPAQRNSPEFDAEMHKVEMAMRRQSAGLPADDTPAPPKPETPAVQAPPVPATSLTKKATQLENPAAKTGSILTDVPAGVAAPVIPAVRSSLVAQRLATRKADLARAAAKAARNQPNGCTDLGTFGTYCGENDNNGLANGLGVLSWPNGDRYEGEHLHGTTTGAGIYYYGQGEILRVAGMWADGHLTGAAIAYRRDGTILAGLWNGTRFAGYGATIDAKRNVAVQGRYENGNLLEPIAP